MPDQEQRPKKTIDERIDALTMGMELHAAMMRDTDSRIDKIMKAIEMDAENIRALARIAEAQEHRLF